MIATKSGPRRANAEGLPRPCVGGFDVGKSTRIPDGLADAPGDYWRRLDQELRASVGPSLAWSEIEPLEPGGGQLYRLYGRDVSDLLYVGISWSAMVRAGQHKSSKSWWPEVSRVLIQNFSDKSEAEHAERVAIITERPLHNIQHNDVAPETRSRICWERARYLSKTLDGHIAALNTTITTLRRELGPGRVCANALWFGWGQAARLAPTGGFRTVPRSAVGWEADATELHPADADFLLGSRAFDAVMTHFQRLLPDCDPWLCEVNCSGLQDYWEES